jgi:Asp-tRNA(Asn)/Glu-tRNA(Gln) amidotransferase A subunit family amidase
VSPLAGAPGLAQLGAVEAADRMKSGALSARDYALALLERVRQTEDQVRAWTCLDPEFLLSQADSADAARGAGLALGPLHGLPVGVKDIIDTSDLPTQNGTVLHAGRQPRRDAAVVSRLRAAGGLVMGKTVTTELATYAPGKTRNPHNGAHTPGGSSSGSAAAVASGMAPLAIGTQTNGSIIRPASFCGVVGYKPSAGWLPRTGVLMQSPPMDQLGVYGRSVEDVALLAQCLAGHDPQDCSTRPRATPPLLSCARSEPAAPPVIGFVRTPMWERMAPDAQQAFLQLAQSLGKRVVELELPQASSGFLELHQLVMEADLAGSFELEYERGRDRLSTSLQGQIERGRQVTAVDYRRALERREAMSVALDGLFDVIDAILTPAALGTAPAGLEATGDPVMCTLWTFTGQPAVSLPLLHGSNGLPLGVQLVGRRDDDARLLRTARWLSRMASPAANQ